MNIQLNEELKIVGNKADPINMKVRVEFMLTKKEQDNLKKQIKLRLMIECTLCGSNKFKREFSYVNTYMGNICMDCQELDNY